MKCPNCQQNLLMTERSGVEIDYCPECRGIWLDRGELDKIIEKSASGGSNRSEKYNEPYSSHSSPKKPGTYKKKPGSFLEDLFDF